MANSDRRRFNASERAALYLAADGKCSRCGVDLESGWHGDHVHPWAAGGPTDVINGQALCADCNLKKGSTVTRSPLAWQQRALDRFYAAPVEDGRAFLVCATPGAGKTFLSLHLAKQLLDQGQIDRVVVVVPTDALRDQWAEAAEEDHGLDLQAVSENEDYDKKGYKGCIATYQQMLGAGANLMRQGMRKPTLAILDEIHHAGDNRSWGTALTTAVEKAAFRVALSGTPWRRDSASPIPFVKYDKDGKVAVDFAYEYGEAVSDGVCRSIEFHAFDGEARWIDRTRAQREGYNLGAVNVEFSAKVSANMHEDDVSAALDVLYDPSQPWIPSILEQADRMLTELREEVADAAALVICERQWHAVAYAKILERITGEAPPVVVSDPVADPSGKIAKKTIEHFRKGRSRWIVAVKMISEGVDIKRLAIGVYASKTQTPLFFRQASGRFVRTRDGEEINARLLIPAVPQLLKHAMEIEDELRHQLELATEQDTDGGEGKPREVQCTFDFREALSASEPVFDRAILRGQECSGEEITEAEDQCRRIGIPTRYAVNLVPMIRAQKFQGAAAPAGENLGGTDKPPTPRRKREKLLRSEITRLVGQLARLTNVEYKDVNTSLIHAGQPPRSQASVEELEETKALLLRWLAAA